tara:strand:- start:43 stop:252 length:210 start_codon:yes stop_codon:yes gene_type:complete
MKYNDYNNVTKDSKAILDIIDRQSDELLFECIADSFVNTLNKFDLSDKEITRAINAKINALKDELLERV